MVRRYPHNRISASILKNCKISVTINLYIYKYYERRAKMKVKYIGDYYKVFLIKNKVYDVMAIEEGAYRIMTEADVDGLFAPSNFEIVEE